LSGGLSRGIRQVTLDVVPQEGSLPNRIRGQGARVVRGDAKGGGIVAGDKAGSGVEGTTNDRIAKRHPGGNRKMRGKATCDGT